MLCDSHHVTSALARVQVVKESQRLFPAAAIGPLRYAEKNTELGGYFIPKGTHVQVGAHKCCDSMTSRFCTYPEGTHVQGSVFTRHLNVYCIALIKMATHKTSAQTGWL
jgi:hypothetical protein